MSPILAWAYVRLARREEAEVRATLGDAYARYAAVTPAFIPRVKRRVAWWTDTRASRP
jgi:methanethiol S-methyltransferase